MQTQSMLRFSKPNDQPPNKVAAANGGVASMLQSTRLVAAVAELCSLGQIAMTLKMSMILDAFQGSGVPLCGDPITSVHCVPLLGLRTMTVLNNCKPSVQEVIKLRFIATNCSKNPIEIIPYCEAGSHSKHNVTVLLPGDSSDFSVFRSWEFPSHHKVTMAYEARGVGRNFARLSYPLVTIDVKAWPNKSLQPTPMGVVSSAGAGHLVDPAWLSFCR